MYLTWYFRGQYFRWHRTWYLTWYFARMDEGTEEKTGAIIMTSIYWLSTWIKNPPKLNLDHIYYTLRNCFAHDGACQTTNKYMENYKTLIFNSNRLINIWEFHSSYIQYTLNGTLWCVFVCLLLLLLHNFCEFEFISVSIFFNDFIPWIYKNISSSRICYKYIFIYTYMYIYIYIYIFPGFLGFLRILKDS